MMWINFNSLNNYVSYVSSHKRTRNRSVACGMLVVWWWWSMLDTILVPTVRSSPGPGRVSRGVMCPPANQRPGPVAIPACQSRVHITTPHTATWATWAGQPPFVILAEIHISRLFNPLVARLAGPSIHHLQLGCGQMQQQNKMVNTKLAALVTLVTRQSHSRTIGHARIVTWSPWGKNINSCDKRPMEVKVLRCDRRPILFYCTLVMLFRKIAMRPMTMRDCLL